MKPQFLTRLTRLDRGARVPASWYIIDVESYEKIKQELLSITDKNLPFITEDQTKRVDGNLFLREDGAVEGKTDLKRFPVETSVSYVNPLVPNRSYNKEDFIYRGVNSFVVKNHPGRPTSFQDINWSDIKQGQRVTEIYYYPENSDVICCLSEGVLICLEVPVIEVPVITEPPIVIGNGLRSLIIELLPFEGTTNEYIAISHIKLMDKNGNVIQPVNSGRAESASPMAGRSNYDLSHGINSDENTKGPDDGIGWKVSELKRRAVRIQYIVDVLYDIGYVEVCLSNKEGEIPKLINVYGSAIDTRTMGLVDFVREPYIKKIASKEFSSPTEYPPKEKLLMTMGTDGDLPKYRTTEYGPSPFTSDLPANTNGGSMASVGNIGHVEKDMQVSALLTLSDSAKAEEYMNDYLYGIRFVDATTRLTLPMNRPFAFIPDHYPLDETGGFKEHDTQDPIIAGTIVPFYDGWNFRTPAVEDCYLVPYFLYRDQPVKGMALAPKAGFKREGYEMYSWYTEDTFTAYTYSHYLNQQIYSAVMASLIYKED